MSEINNSTRSPFFPNSKSAKEIYQKRIDKAETNPLNRNAEERSQEIINKTSSHAKVDIDNKVKDFATIKKAVDNSAEIDNSEKIAKLKAQIQAGTYNVDYDALADKLLESEF